MKESTASIHKQKIGVFWHTASVSIAFSLSAACTQRLTYPALVINNEPIIPLQLVLFFVVMFVNLIIVDKIFRGPEVEPSTAKEYFYFSFITLIGLTFFSHVLSNVQYLRGDGL
jgi:hypothetical protein